jgi:hypothetical protein
VKKYCCSQLGACQKATVGEIFEREPGDDLKCPECGHLMELHFSEATTGTSGRGRSLMIAAGVAVAVLVVGGTGWTFLRKSDGDDKAAGVAPVSLATAGSTPGNPSGMAPSAADIAQQKADGQAKLQIGDGAGAESASVSAASNELVKAGIAQMAQNKLEDAEKSFTAAVTTDPKQSLGYYNMGILRLRQGRTDDAIKQFEASFMVGFKYFDQLDQDPDLDTIKKDPRFAELLMRYQPANSKAATVKQ